MAAMQAGLTGADAVIAPSAAHARALRDVYGPLSVRVVHNGSRGMPSPAPRVSAVVTAGRLWDAGKAVDWLDRAAPGLAVPVVAAGSCAGPDGTVVRFPNLRCLGQLAPDRLATEFASATVYASMARYEPFGLAVLEAAGAGMALVLSDTPGFRELWNDAAIFVDTEAALRPALQRALADPAPWAARAQARSAAYTLDRMVDGTLAVHRSVTA
ncbi:MAG: glycosyltransferase family 4 protein [Gemmatimonadaceae bacterium]|nr:glycosyltransferase family 4 protein [Acetobacteraceae bacterium]